LHWQIAVGIRILCPVLSVSVTVFPVSVHFPSMQSVEDLELGQVRTLKPKSALSLSE
jgi:hypothetical protein